MRHAVPALSVLAVAVAVAVAVAGCGSRTGSGPTVLRLASPDPAGLAHQPAIAAFARDVERLSGGRMRIVADESRSGGGTGNADEPALLRDVARGRADLGWAHARSLPEVGVRTFVLPKGQIVVAGEYDDAAEGNNPGTIPVVGGTGAYAGGRGTLTSAGGARRRLTLTIRLR